MIPWLTSRGAFKQIDLQKVRNDFGLWLPRINPSWHWEWPHLVYTREQLDKITTGEIDRLMITEPPRHGKTEMVTVRYPVWRLERDPDFRVIVGAYNQTYANTFSRKARQIALRRIPLSTTRRAAESWQTTGDGGLRAVGVGSGVTGSGGDLIVVDDPVKSREEANSGAYRERVWSWWKDDLYTRLEPGAAMILIMTRWHEDDLAGRILASEDGPNWTLVNLPAEAEADDPLGREIGEALCPERFNLTELERIKRVLGSWSYASLYQQRPLPAEGGLAKRTWFTNFVTQVPEGYTIRQRAWDLAATKAELVSSDPDYTVGTLLARQEGRNYVEDVVRVRLGPGGVELVVKQTAAMDGYGVPIHFAQDPGQAGKAQVAAFVRMLNGYVVTSHVVRDKLSMAMPFLAQAEHGNVILVRGDWNRAWVEEFCVFPVGTHDDQVYATCDAYNNLSDVRTPIPRVRVRIRRGGRRPRGADARRQR